MCAITVINTAQRQATVRSPDFQEGFALQKQTELNLHREAFFEPSPVDSQYGQ